MAEIKSKTPAPIVDLSWIHETSKLTGSQEDNSSLSQQANDSREKSANLPQEHKIVIVLN